MDCGWCRTREVESRANKAGSFGSGDVLGWGERWLGSWDGVVVGGLSWWIGRIGRIFS